MDRVMRRVAPLALALGLVAPAAARADVTPLGLTCQPQDGVRLCQGAKVPTFDGVPLDVDVALPASGDSRLPLVVQLHGWGGRKSGLPDMRPWAQEGYAVLNYTARGFGESCGSPASRAASPAGCARGWVHLADTRFEVRDTQFLAGRLADQGIVDAQRIGTTGGSYGGGQSMALAALRDRQMNDDGSLTPWRSPGGRAMRIAAAAPIIPWTDLAYSLVPNGRTLDYAVTGQTQDLNPVGVEKQSFVSGLYALGSVSGYYAPVGVDPDADLTQWFALTNAGEPYGANPQTASVVNEIAKYHSSYYIPGNQPPAPLFISNGWTDDLFPPDEALRFYNRLRATYPSSPIKLMFFDFGHQRGQGKAADTARLRDAISRWFDHYVKGEGPRPADDVTALTQTCPKTAPSAGPFTALTWDGLHPGEVRRTFPAAQIIRSGAGDPQVSQAVDPITGPGACARTSAGDISGAATYRLPAATGQGFTLLGSPTVSGRFAVSGASPEDSQVAARLWDVASDGMQTLVARGLYRPVGSGVEVFQLHANGYRFAPGHVAKLELLGQDAPYGRTSNGSFTITAGNVELRLPVHESPGGAVRAPAVCRLPRGARAAPGSACLGVTVRYRTRQRTKARRALRCWTSARAALVGPGVATVRRADFLLGKRRMVRDRRRPFAGTLSRSAVRRAKSRRLRVRALLRTGRSVTISRTLATCPPRARG